MEFRLLGPLEVVEHDRALALGGAKQRALLALLLLHPNDVVPTEQLIDELWGGSPPATVAKSVQIYVSRLRKQLGEDRLITRRPGYLVRVDPSESDVARFESLLSEAAGAEPETAARRLREALGLWRGPPLADLAYEPFAQAPIVRLEELRLVTVEQRIEAELQLGRHAELVGELEALVGQHPLRERLRGQLMLALYRSGRQADALGAYRRGRDALVEELGLEPGRPLRELHSAILAQDPALDLPAPAAAPAGAASSPFVGRERELGELDAALDDALAGRGRLVLLSGEPGIGKSRLAEELMARASARGARVLVGRCWEAGGAPAYWPWVQSLRAYVRDADPAALRSQLGAGAADLAQIVPVIRRHLPDLPERHRPDSEGARFRLFDATAEFLRNASAERPIVVVLDDLHAADAPSLLLLQFFARELRSMRLLVLAAYRDVDPVPGEVLTGVLAEVAREPAARRLRLGGLPGSDVARYLALASPEAARDDLARALRDRSGGNPLFVEELVRLLVAERGGREPADALALSIPETIQDVIGRRLDHLSRPCRRILEAASAIGREFPVPVLARACDVPEEEVLDTLEEATMARELAEVPGAPTRLRFAHVLIRDALYESLPATRRVRLHRAVLATLEALNGVGPGPHLAQLAHHAMRAGDDGKAQRYSAAAAEWALGMHAYEEACRLYRIALAALEHSGPGCERARCETLLALGEAEARAGDRAAARSAFLDAARLARALSLPRALARAAAGYGGRIVWVRAGADHRVVPLLEEALAALPEDELALRARLLARLAGALRDERSRRPRDELSREAVALARRSGDPDVLAYALAARGHAIIAPDAVAECLAIGDELRAVARTSGDEERMVAGYSLRMTAQLMAGDIAAAVADVEIAGRIAEQLRQPIQLWDLCSTRAMLALATGRLDEAEELVPRALRLGERAMPEAAIAIHRLHRCTLAEFRGELGEHEPSLRAVADDHPTRPVFRCALAHLQARTGRRAEAVSALDELTWDDCSALPFDQEWLFGMSLLAETAALVEDREAAATLHRLLLPWEDFAAADSTEGFRGSNARGLALLAAVRGRDDEAARHFEVALERNARMGARPWLAHTRLDYARWLLARDRPRALQLLAGALATYQELGMEPWVAAAAELERRTRRPAGRA